MTLKWIIVAILFSGEAPIHSVIIPAESATSAKECTERAEEHFRVVRDGGADVWFECIEVKRTAPKRPTTVPRPDAPARGRSNS